MPMYGTSAERNLSQLLRLEIATCKTQGNLKDGMSYSNIIVICQVT